MSAQGIVVDTSSRFQEGVAELSWHLMRDDYHERLMKLRSMRTEFQEGREDLAAQSLKKK